MVDGREGEEINYGRWWQWAEDTGRGGEEELLQFCSSGGCGCVEEKKGCREEEKKGERKEKKEEERREEELMGLGRIEENKDGCLEG